MIASESIIQTVPVMTAFSELIVVFSEATAVFETFTMSTNDSEVC